MVQLSVPSQRGDILVSGDVLAGRAVRAITYQDWSQLAMWSLGRGGQLIPCTSVASKMVATRNYEARVMVKPHYQAVARAYQFSIRGTSVPGTVDISVNGATATTHSIPGNRAHVVPITILEELATQSTTPVIITLEMQPDVAAQVDSVSMFEIPRAILEDNANELGVALSPFSAGSPHRSADWLRGVAAVADQMQARRHIYQWTTFVLDNSVVTTTYAIPITSGTFADVFPTIGGGPPGLGRKPGPSVIKRALAARFLLEVSGGATAEVRLVSSVNGNGTTYSTTSATPVWVGGDGAVDVDCEDVDTTDGLQSSAYDLLALQARISAGAGTCYLFATSAWEDATL